MGTLPNKELFLLILHRHIYTRSDHSEKDLYSVYETQEAARDDVANQIALDIKNTQEEINVEIFGPSTKGDTHYAFWRDSVLNELHYQYTIHNISLHNPSAIDLFADAEFTKLLKIEPPVVKEEDMENFSPSIKVEGDTANSVVYIVKTPDMSDKDVLYRAFGTSGVYKTKKNAVEKLADKITNTKERLKRLTINLEINPTNPYTRKDFEEVKNALNLLSIATIVKVDVSAKIDGD